MLPRFVHFRRSLQSLPPVDVENTLRTEWQKLNLANNVAGKNIALGIGSRGIRHLPLMVKTVAALLHESGAHPFIVPAMGSHGNATAEGQVEVLRDLGITDSSAGCPIRATMNTVLIGNTSENLPAYQDEFAAGADGVILLNRIKPHTSFTGELESGLHKMLAIGLGKEKAASLLHAGGPRSLRENMPKVARYLLEKSNFLAGFGIVEDALQNPVAIRGLDKTDMEAGEKELLALARGLMPSLPLPDWDVVIVDEMGKDISGTGMDTHVIGRMRIRGEPELESPRIKSLAVLRLTAATHGNALGIGLADFTTKEALAAIDFEKTGRNVLTTGNIERGRIPIVCANPREALEEALRYARRGRSESLGNASVLRIRNTLKLEEFFVSENYVDAIRALPRIEQAGPPIELQFTSDEWAAA